MKKLSMKKVKWGLQFFAVVLLASSGMANIASAISLSSEETKATAITETTFESKPTQEKSTGLTSAGKDTVEATRSSATTSSSSSQETQADASTSRQLTILGTSDVHGQFIYCENTLKSIFIGSF